MSDLNQLSFYSISPFHLSSSPLSFSDVRFFLPALLFHPNIPADLLISRNVQVSKASSELMNYCEQHARNDPLLVGVPASENPFKDKKPCIIL